MKPRRDVGPGASRSVVLAPILKGKRKVGFWLGVAAWLVAAAFFWLWWLNPAHVQNPVLYILLTLTLAWATVGPTYFIVNYAVARRPVGKIADLPPLRVAMVVTKAPSEPFEVVAKTLEAMLAQSYPHDTWLADENPSPETYAWCEAHGVQVSTRYGREDYHRKTWPRRTRCKEGNLAFFYDHYGYDRYDVVSQLDADHVPTPGYLEQMLIPFADPDVGYVSAPSICDSNADESWSARGRLYWEGNVHGALQAGYTGIGGPLCIGSHYAVRTSALREIGGLGPELAEDHATTMMMCAHGWRGVHALDAIAHGEGPKTFADMITQEFQWARSVTAILLAYSPKYLGSMTPRLRTQFIFCQLWYLMSSLLMTAGVLLPIIAVSMQVNLANVTFPDFVVHALPLSLVLMANAFHWRSHGTFRPIDVKLLAWETMAYQFVRWPWTLLGCIAAVHEHVTRKFVDFRVTPKGMTEVAPLPFRVLAPYALISLASALPAILVPDADVASGFYIFTLLNALIYGGLLVLIVYRHRVENQVRRDGPLARVAVSALMVVVLALPMVGLWARGLEGLYALEHGVPGLSIVHTAYSPSGAGQKTQRILRFQPSWSP